MVFNLLSQIFLTKAELDKRTAFKKEIVGFFKDWKIKPNQASYNNNEYVIDCSFGTFEDKFYADKSLLKGLTMWQKSALRIELNQERQRRLVKLVKEIKQQYLNKNGI